MATVKHPTIKGVSYDVDDADVDRWRKAGWTAPAPRKPKPAKASETTDEK